MPLHSATGSLALDDTLKSGAQKTQVVGTPEIALNAATLAALEQITVAVSGGSVALDPTSLAALEEVLVSGTVSLSPASLAALESITATISGSVDLSPGSLAALESITAAITGTVALDPATLSALEAITATISGTVSVEGTVEITNDIGNPIPVSDNAIRDRLPAAGAASEATLGLALTALQDLAADDDGVARDTTTAAIRDRLPSSGAAAESTQLLVSAGVVSRFGGGKSAKTAQVTASGDTTIHTPATGRRTRLYWISALNDPDAVQAPRIVVKFGSTEIYRGYAIAHWEVFTGAANEPLVVTLDQTGDVAVTIHYEEIT